jgi:hypothetical protein
MKRVCAKVYFTENEYKLVEGCSANESVSGFIRRTVLNNLYPQAKAEQGSTPLGKGKTCPHGIARGWRCWQCGGPAIINA